MSFAVAATIGTTLIAANATRGAAKSASAASDRATQLQKDIFDQQRSDQTPYRLAGYSAIDKLQELLGLSPSVPTGIDGKKYPGWTGSLEPGVGESINAITRAITGGAVSPFAGTQAPRSADYGMLTRQFTGDNLQNDPGYAFGLQQGTQAIERGASARGGLYSGATLKALQRYGQDYGGTKFNEAFNRDRVTKNDLFNQLSGLSGTGQIATNQVGQAGQNYANQAGNIGLSNANMQGAAGLAQANILRGGVNQALSMWNQQPQGGGSATWGSWTPAEQSAYMDPYYSDSRLKVNIRRIGTTERGNALYAWDWKTGGSGHGVIAQEVAHIPGAVTIDADGLMMVDYSKV